MNTQGGFCDLAVLSLKQMANRKFTLSFVSYPGTIYSPPSYDVRFPIYLPSLVFSIMRISTH